MADNSDEYVTRDELAERTELEVRRALAESEGQHREFLMKNTRYVIAGFFGVITVFGGVVSFVLGNQLDERHVEAIAGAVVTNQIENMIEIRTGAILEVKSHELMIAIERIKDQAVDEISGIVAIESKNAIAEQLAPQIEAVRQEFLQTPPEEIVRSILVAGAVIAFDREVGCPKTGWTEFKQGVGRVIVGAGKGDGLEERKFLSEGGQEVVQLTLTQMPPHNHEFSVKPVTRGGWGGQATRHLAVGGSEAVSDFSFSGTIGHNGGGEPHKNMPPYVALYFCKKT